MKKIWLCIVLNTFSIYPYAQRVGEHQFVYRYKFNHTWIDISNDFIRDSMLKFSPQFIHAPFDDRHLSIFGPHLTIKVTHVRPEDSIIAVGYVVDTTAKDVTLFYINDLQVRVTLNGNANKPWQDISSLAKFTDTSFFKKDKKTALESRFIFNDTMALNNSIILEFRNKRTAKTLTRFHFTRPAILMLPHLAIYQHDTSGANSPSTFIQENLTRKAYELNLIDHFYHNWPGYGLSVKNEHCYENSKLAFFFSRPELDMPDSSLEYRLNTDHSIDNRWHTTGHLLLFTHLLPGNNYTLQIRYAANPGVSKIYTFYVAPPWYRTTAIKMLLAGISIILMLLAVLFVYRFRIRNEKEKREKLSLQLQSIRSQLNPHFVFNALASIQALINKKETEKANIYLSDFSNLLRETLHKNKDEYSLLSAELNLSENYARLEQLRFHFDFSISADKNIHTNEIEVPTLLLQPLIENAVKHGVSGKLEEGIIKITIHGRNRNLLITISDNGPGFTAGDGQKGFGLTLTKERLHLLNQSLKGQSIKINIGSGEGGGTAVHLIFENWL